MSDLETIMKSLDEVGAKINAVDADGKASVEAVKSKLKELGEEQVKFARELAALQQASVDAESQAVAVKSVGQQFVDSASYKAFSVDGSNDRGARHTISLKTDTPTTSVVGTGITRTTLAQPTQLPGIYGAPDLPLLIENLIPHIPVQSSSVEYLKNSAFSNGAGVVAEGASKPESTFTFRR